MRQRKLNGFSPKEYAKLKAATEGCVCRLSDEIKTSERMAFADHVYAASEPRVEDTMTAEDRKEQFGEECVYCGKDSWTCEHFKPEDNQ